MTTAVVLLSAGCVKPVQDTQTVYNGATQANTYNNQPVPSNIYNPQAPVIYEDAQPITYTGNGVAAQSGVIYEDVNPASTVITTTNVGSTTTYPDPYANGGSSFPNPYDSQPAISDYPTYPAATNYPATPSSPAVGGGIHLQVAALKDYSTAEDYKNRLSLAPGMSAYVQRGAMNKVIVTGIPSISEANRLKENRFPGAFIVQGASSSTGYTPPSQPTYNPAPSGGVYSINNPYGSASSSTGMSGNSGVGIQIGAFGSRAKAQSIANNQGGQYPAVVKKIGQYYKVILTGFSSRSAAKSALASGRVSNGFVVSIY